MSGTIYVKELFFFKKKGMVWRRSPRIATSVIPRLKKIAFGLPVLPYLSRNSFLEFCLSFIGSNFLACSSLDLVDFFTWCTIDSLIGKFHIFTNEVHLCLAYKVILVSAAGWVPRFLQKATAQGAGNAKFNPERGQPSSWERLSIQQRWYETCKNGSVEKQLYHPTWHYPGMLYRCQGNAMPLGNVCHRHAWRAMCLH